MISDAQYKDAMDFGKKLLIRRGATPEDAEDAVQDAALSACATSHPWDGRSRFTTWFCKVVINARLQQVRRRDYKYFADPVSLHPGMRVVDVTAEDQAIREEEREQLLGAIAELTPGHYSAVNLVYIYGMKATEAASLLGIPNNTMKARLHRSRAMIKSQLCSNPQH